MSESEKNEEEKNLYLYLQRISYAPDVPHDRLPRSFRASVSCRKK